MDRSYLEIPYTEHIVPFPNAAAVLMQHGREFADKNAWLFQNKAYTFGDLLNLSLNLTLPEHIQLSFSDIENDLVLFLAALVQGVLVSVDFNKKTNVRVEDLDMRTIRIQYFEPPYVKLDDPAFKLNDQIHFTQYHILVAARAVGNAFKLFRKGDAACPDMISNIADLTFGVLAPLYFCKTTCFIPDDTPNRFQYAWKREIESDLRDAAMLFPKGKSVAGSFMVERSFDEALGLGPILSTEGERITLLGAEFRFIDGNWQVSGHCIGEKD